MTATSADRVITALRRTHQDLEKAVGHLTGAQLEGASAAAPWTVADVLSHLGSGAVIALATLEAAATGQPSPTPQFHRQTWDHWDALPRTVQAQRFLVEDDRLVTTLESLDHAEREKLRIPQDHLGDPLPLAGYAGMRLNEVALHAWDIQAARDHEAVLPDDTAQLLAELFCGDLQFLLRFAGKPDALGHPAVIGIADSPYTLVIGTSITLTRSKPPSSATYHGPTESLIRLITGRLPPGDTQAHVSGNVTTDQLRQVFPGY